MKKITEANLNKIINESVQKHLNEYLLSEKISKMVREQLENAGLYYNEEKDEDEDDEDIENQTLDDLGLGDKTLKDLGIDADDLDDSIELSSDSSDDDDKKNSKKSDEEEEDNTGVNQIEKYFNKSGIDNAPFAYELFDVKPEKGKDTNDMKNARHLFAAKKNHDLNDNGYPYSFTPSEKNELQNMISSAGLSEAKINKSVDKAIKKILK